MDFSAISAALTSLTAARDIGKGMLAVRDANAVSTLVTQLNDKLLQAQEALFTHQTAMLTLQQEHIEACEKLRKLEESVNQRRRYSLVEISYGNFAYRVKVGPQEGGAGEPSATEPSHLICQPCFDNGKRFVLQLKGRYSSLTDDVARLWLCSGCNVELAAGPGV